VKDFADLEVEILIHNVADREWANRTAREKGTSRSGRVLGP